MFLQTTAAAKKWPVREQLVADLRTAMAECCPTAAAAERQKQQRGQRDLEWQGLVPGTNPGDQQEPQQQQLKKRKKKGGKTPQHQPQLDAKQHTKPGAKQHKRKKVKPSTN
eukprot:GHUV01023826.1.p1 GENE.GHUV01023826.1~~GHUV01023826.1.p1  ORF type:complete len:111 (+),score=52.98 GHUV01023826.1:641-973(+)